MRLNCCAVGFRDGGSWRERYDEGRGIVDPFFGKGMVENG